MLDQEPKKNRYYKTFPSTTICFHEPYAYFTLTNFGEGKGLFQVHSDFGSYSYFWGSMGDTIEGFLANVSASYVHTKLSSTMTYQGMKRDHQNQLSKFMIVCWPDFHEKIKAIQKG